MVNLTYHWITSKYENRVGNISPWRWKQSGKYLTKKPNRPQDENRVGNISPRNATNTKMQIEWEISHQETHQYQDANRVGNISPRNATNTKMQIEWEISHQEFPLSRRDISCPPTSSYSLCDIYLWYDDTQQEQWDLTVWLWSDNSDKKTRTFYSLNWISQCYTVIGLKQCVISRNGKSCNIF